MAPSNTSVTFPLALDPSNRTDRDFAASEFSGFLLPGILQALAPQSSAPQSLIIVDPSVDRYEMLLDGVLDETQVFVLDGQDDAIAQITALLNTHQPISELHLVSHGAPGQLQFSNAILSDANLNRYSAQLQQWQTYFVEDAELVLYGCEVASCQAGQTFLQQLGQLTGLSIAANSQPTGNKALGGTWSLSYRQPSEKASASVAAVSLAFATETLAAYPGLLAVNFNQETFGVGDYPVSVAVGDLNGDSIPDVVASNAGFGDDSVSVLLGDGSGGLSADTTYAMGDAPYSAILADFNGDSVLDVATTSRFGQVVSVRLGDGSGGLGSRSFFTVGGRLSVPISVTAGDFNGDSILDLAVVKVFEDQLSVFQGDGSGGFGSRANFATDKYPNSVITADFNGDSILDLAVANRGNNIAGNGDNISIRLGNGSGGFGAESTFAAGNRTYDIAAGDFNGDSILDLVATNNYGDSISVLLGDGSGGFGPQSTYAVDNGPYSVAVGDLNNDSILDIAVTNYDGDSVSVFEGDGSGGFSAEQVIDAGNGPHSVAITDFNDDGLLDLVVANFNDENVEIFLNDRTVDHTIGVDTSHVFEGDSGTQTITFTITRTGFTGTSSSVDYAITGSATNGEDYINLTGVSGLAGTLNFAAGETSKTITLDVVGDVLYEAIEGVTVTLSDASTISTADATISTAAATHTILNDELAVNFSERTDIPTGNAPYSIAVGDFNEDGNEDLAVSNWNIDTTDDVFLYQGDGSGGFSDSSTLDSGNRTRTIVTADFNGDSHLDLATLDENSDTFSVFLGDGSGGFSDRTSYDLGNGRARGGLAVGDFNRDSVADIVVADNSREEVQLFLGNGTGGFSDRTTILSGVRFRSIEVGDLDGDGFDDIVTTSYYDDEIRVAFVDGFSDNALQADVVFLDQDRPNDVEFGDFNSDSILDLAITTEYNSLRLFFGDGDRDFTKGTSIIRPGISEGLVVGDVNDDGQPDVLIRGRSLDDIGVLLGDGSGGFTDRTTIDVGSYARDIALGDFNGDSLVDLAVANRNEDDVSILLNQPVPVAYDDSFATDEDTAITDGNVFADNGIGEDFDRNNTFTATAVNGDDTAIGTEITLTSGALLTLNSDGTFVYNPNGAFDSLATGESDTDTFTYTISDEPGETDTATVTITISGLNSPITALSDSGTGFTTDEDSSFTTSSVLSNDSDPDTSGLAVCGFDTTGTLGIVTNNGDGTFDYDPNGAFDSLALGESGTDTFTYTVTNDDNQTASATVTVTITGVEDPLVATADSGTGFTTDEDSSFTTGSVLDNDSDPDSLPLSVAGFDTTGTLGLVMNNDDGTFDYDPNGAFDSLAPGESGTDSFTYTVANDDGTPDTATVTITITGVEDPIVANADSGVGFTTDEDSSFTTGNVLTNDSDPDSLPLSVTGFDTTGTLGLVTNNGDGTFDYDPIGAFDSLAPGESGTDSFTYTVANDDGTTDTATVTITITGQNNVPIANNDTGSVTENGTTSINLTGNDTDPDTSDDLNILSLNTSGTQGNVSIDSGSDSVTYDSGTAFDSLAGGESATDMFTYTVSDGNGGSNTATVTVTITGENDSPSAVADSASVTEGSTTSINLTGNDTDPDTRDNLDILSLNASGTQGNVSIDSGSDSVTYNSGTAFDSLAGGESATDTFTYTVSDGNGGSDTATVIVTITGENDSPIATDDSSSSFITDEDSSFTIGNVLANDSDPDGDELSVTSTDTSPLKGLLTDNGDGTFIYDPNGQFETLPAGASATDTFTYTIEDSAGDSSTATVRLAIAGVNDAPTVSNRLSNQKTKKGTLFSYNLPTDTFADVDLGDSLTLSANQLNGDALPTWLTFDGSSFSGAARAKDVSIYYLQVTATDGEGASVSTPFALTVNPSRTVAGMPGNIDETVNGTQGADVLRGFNGNDILRGRGGNDKLNGGSGDDLLIGNGGNDVLIGQAGNDTLVGGTGSDLYVLQQNKGKDTVQGFAIDSDKIVLGALSFSDIRIGTTSDGNSTNIIIRSTNEKAMVIEDLQSSLLTESDFMSLG